MRWAPPLAFLLGLIVLGTAAGATPRGTEGGPIPSGAPLATNFSANFSLAGIGPEADVPAGSNLAIEYEVRDPSFGSGQAGLYVHVPSPEALFNVSWGIERSFLPGTTILFNSTNWTSPLNATPTIFLANETVFSNTGVPAKDRAILSTEGVAVTAPLPLGSLTIELRWRWVVAPSAGANISGAWIPSANGVPIEPGQYAQLVLGAGASLSPGQPYSACLYGSVANRTFQLQVLLPNPHLLVGATSATAPFVANGTFCFGLDLPSWLLPQTVQIDVWNIVPSASPGGNASTLLLYLLKAQVVPAATGPATWLGLPTEAWYIGGTALAGVTGLGIVGYAMRRPEPVAPPAEDDPRIEP